MDKQLSSKIKKLDQSYEAYEELRDRLSDQINDICEFDACITYCSGDGHLVLNLETSAVAFVSCLKGKTKQKKLTDVEHWAFSI